MLYQVISYIKFLFRSSNQHGVHSPFVYDLVTKCLYSKEKLHNLQILSKHRTQLRNDNTILSVKDFGAGSRIFKNNQRSVAAIAKHAGISNKRQQLLFRLAHYLQPSHTLELGTSLGMGTLAMAAGNPNGQVVSVEGCPETSKKAIEHLQKIGVDNVTVVNESFEAFFQQNPSKNYDLVYIDGNHNKEATLSHFNTLLSRVSNDSILIFDDIYWSKEMTAAWLEIIQHPKVTVSIDSFQWGVVFFRTEQPKQHFTIRM